MTDRLSRHAPALVLVVLCLFASLRYDTFLTLENILNVLRQNSVLGIAAVGVTCVILAGGIDLSVGALIALASVLAASFSHYGTLAALAVAVASTAVIGCANGVVVAYARIQPFVVTLATMSAARGAALMVTNERAVPLSSHANLLATLGRGRLAGVPVSVWILMATTLLAWFALTKLRVGRHVYATGDNEEAARLMGLRVDRVQVATYTVSGVFAGAAGVLLAARLGAGHPTVALGWELDAIVAVVVGGTALGGGRGGVVWTIVGVLLLGLMLNMFNLEGSISSWWQWIVRGALLLAVMAVQTRVVHRKGRVATARVT